MIEYLTFYTLWSFKHGEKPKYFIFNTDVNIRINYFQFNLQIYSDEIQIVNLSNNHNSVYSGIKFYNFLKRILYYNLVLRFILESYLELTLSTMINLSKVNLFLIKV